jgi:hypothetical protein
LAIFHCANGSFPYLTGKVCAPVCSRHRRGLVLHARCRDFGTAPIGKSTLARILAGEEAIYRTLDEPDLLSFARSDPVGFLDVGDRRLVIDEIQRVPQLILPLKTAVDRDNRPGRFLITGSADLSALSSPEDALTGRLVRKVLLPLSQTELTSDAPRFLDAALRGDLPQPARDARPFEEVVAAGGYPEPVALPPNFRRQWFDAYAAVTAQRDVADVLSIERPDIDGSCVATRLQNFRSSQHL